MSAGDSCNREPVRFVPLESKRRPVQINIVVRVRCVVLQLPLPLPAQEGGATRLFSTVDIAIRNEINVKFICGYCIMMLLHSIFFH